MNFTLRQLQGFLAVAELGSFTRAAARLGLTQSALSVLVAELERALRVRLLDRTTRAVALTEAGRQFRASADKVMADLDHAMRHAHLFADRQHGRVAVAAPPRLAATLLPRAIARHAAAWPGIAVHLVDVGTDQIVQRLKSGEADLALGTFARTIDGLDRTLLARDRLVLACPAAHPLAARPKAKGRDIPWAALSGQQLILLTRESGVRVLAEQAWHMAGLMLHPAHEVAQIATALALVQAGLGVAVLPAYAVGRHPGVVARPLGAPAMARDIELVHLAGRSLSPGGQSLAEAIRTEAGRRGAWGG